MGISLHCSYGAVEDIPLTANRNPQWPFVLFYFTFFGKALFCRWLSPHGILVRVFTVKEKR